MRSSLRIFSIAPTAATCPVTSSKGAGPDVLSSATKPFSAIPGPPMRPLVGNHRFANKSIADYTEYLIRLHEDYGPVVRENLGFGRGSVVHVFNPEDSERVFRTDGRRPYIVPLQESTQKYREMRGMNPGLGNLNGEEWYRLRSAVQQTLMRPQEIDKYVPLVENVAATLVHHIAENSDEKGEVDMRKVAGRWSLESAGLVVFERRLGALGDGVRWADELVELNHDIFKLSAQLKFAVPLHRYITTRKWRKMVKLEDRFYREADKLMDDAIVDLKWDKTKAQTTNTTKQKMMSTLINHPDLEERDAKVIMLSLFSDGLSTTAPMLIYNLYNLATHPHAQQKIREELKEFIKEGGDLTLAKRNRLPYLRACIKETFRLFPIGTEISRIPQSELVLGGYTIPAGTPIDINTNVLMRSPKLFPSPNEFIPERWLRESKGQSREEAKHQCEVHPFAFLPFGFGPRMCAGRRFAEQDLQVVLSRLITNYDVSRGRGEIRQKYETLLLPDGDCRFRFEKIVM